MKANRNDKLRKERRMGVVPVAITVMAQHLMTPKHGVRVIGLPIDAVFLTAFYMPQSDNLNFVYGHESFDKVPEGQNLPLLDVYYEEYMTVSAPKQEAKDADQ